MNICRRSQARALFSILRKYQIFFGTRGILLSNVTSAFSQILAFQCALYLVFHVLLAYVYPTLLGKLPHTSKKMRRGLLADDFMLLNIR